MKYLSRSSTPSGLYSALHCLTGTSSKSNTWRSRLRLWRENPLTWRTLDLSSVWVLPHPATTSSSLLSPGFVKHIGLSVMHHTSYWKILEQGCHQVLTAKQHDNNTWCDRRSATASEVGRWQCQRLQGDPAWTRDDAPPHWSQPDNGNYQFLFWLNNPY